MQFYKNIEISREFEVAPATVTNWVEAAKKGNIDLELVEVSGRHYILRTQHNHGLLMTLKLKGKKHAAATKTVEVRANSKLYKIFSPDQIAELINSIQSKNEIPYKFSYMDMGADLWNEHYGFILQNPDSFVYRESKLIEDNIQTLLNRLAGYDSINIFDVGCGNGLPVVPIIEALKVQNKPFKYFAMDISEKMINIDKEHLLKQYPNIDFTPMVIDFDRFNISNDLLKARQGKKAANIILYLGGTLGNQTRNDTQRIFANLRDSMGVDDYLVISTGVYSNKNVVLNRRHNEYHIKRTTWILDLLGLEGHYNFDEIIDSYDVYDRMQVRNIPILSDMEITVKVGEAKNIITIERGTELNVFKFISYTEAEIVEQLVNSGFAIDQFTTNQKGNIALITVRPRRV